MDRINVAGFYLLGSRVHPLLAIQADAAISDLLPIFADADEYLHAYVNAPTGPRAEESRNYAEELQRTMERIAVLPPRLVHAGLAIAIPGRISASDVQTIHQLVEWFESTFFAEMPRKGIFYVTPKRGYSTDILLSQAEANLPDNVVPRLNDFEVENIREAGSCLVFDRFTAVGAHILRATESVARRYYGYLTARNHARITLGNLTRELRDYFDGLVSTNASTGLLGLVITPLDQLCRLYRNPISHPELIALNENQAIDAFQHSVSAISTMIQDLLNGGTHFSSPPSI
jgi:hypothetical protein